MIKFDVGCEAHGVVYAAIAERALVVMLKQFGREPMKVMVISADDYAIECRPEPPTGGIIHMPYQNIEECVIL